MASTRTRPQRLVGAGALRRIDEIPEFFEARDIVLVHGAHYFEACGAAQALEGLTAHMRVRRFSDFEPNPTLASLQRGLACLAAGPCHAIIAVGGGTAMDLAKLLSACATRPAEAVQHIRAGAAVVDTGPPIIAVPTTAGSGSEATHFAVIYIDGHKRSVAHPALRPAAAIIDPDLTESLSPRLTAVSGLDALTQAVESYWCVHSTPQSRRWARRALQLILRHLVPAVHDPHPDDRAAMAEAAHLAGRAIDVSRTTACHALSYTMTARWGVPHGLAVGLTLGPMYRYNHDVATSDVLDPRGAAFVRRTMRELDSVLDVRGGLAGEACIHELLVALGLPTSLRAAGILEDDAREQIAAGVNAERLANSPRRLTAGALREILASI